MSEKPEHLMSEAERLATSPDPHDQARAQRARESELFGYNPMHDQTPTTPSDRTEPSEADRELASTFYSDGGPSIEEMAQALATHVAGVCRDKDAALGTLKSEYDELQSSRDRAMELNAKQAADLTTRDRRIAELEGWLAHIREILCRDLDRDRDDTSKRVGKYLISTPKEPDGFCVWCHAPYYVGDKTYAHPITREVHCSKKCADDHDANL